MKVVRLVGKLHDLPVHALSKLAFANKSEKQGEKLVLTHCCPK